VSGRHAPLVSLVTPVYNGGEYLRECIESVLAQTYDNWRYVIVNNCSADDTLDIAREYAARDERISVSNNTQFLPIVQNHNHALTQIDPASVYCKPVMADDWLYPECLERLVACALERPAVGLVCARALTGTNRVLFDRLPPAAGEECTHLSGREAGRAGLLNDGYFFGSPTTMLMRTDLVRKRTPFYNPDNLQADEEACYDILRECDFAFVHKVLAYVRTHARSYTSATYYLFTMPSCHTYTLARYGHEYLTDQEFARRMHERLQQYYARLALGAVEQRGAEFWAYHRQMLQMIGAPFDRLKLTGAIASHVVRKIVSPTSLARVIGGRLASASRRVSGRSS
jgi:glycosyltransferase involved in cell wall biosynthesis